jgi:hypothetical protein
LAANHNVSAFIQQSKRRSFYSVGNFCSPLTGPGVNPYQVVTISHGDGIGVRDNEIGYTLISAFVAPQYLARAHVNCADAIRSPLNRFAVFETRKLPTRAYVQYIANQN